MRFFQNWLVAIATAFTRNEAICQMPFFNIPLFWASHCSFIGGVEGNIEFSYIFQNHPYLYSHSSVLIYVLYMSCGCINMGGFAKPFILMQPQCESIKMDVSPQPPQESFWQAAEWGWLEIVSSNRLSQKDSWGGWGETSIFDFGFEFKTFCL